MSASSKISRAQCVLIVGSPLLTALEIWWEPAEGSGIMHFMTEVIQNMHACIAVVPVFAIFFMLVSMIYW